MSKVDRKWKTFRGFDLYEGADACRTRLIESNAELIQGENIQVKYKREQFEVRIAVNRITDETAKALAV